MLPWETKTGTGDGIYSYNQIQANEFFRDFANANNSSAGVLYGIDDMLEVTGVATPLNVASGKAFCYGRYWNNTDVSLPIAIPASDTGFAIKLRTVWATNTTRIVADRSTAGDTTIPALTQASGNTWEIYLATGVIDSGGNIWTDATKTVAGVADARSFAIAPTAGMVKLRHVESIADGVITVDNLQSDLSHLKIIISPGATGAIVAPPAWLGIKFFANTGSVANHVWRSHYYNGASHVINTNVISGISTQIDDIAITPTSTAGSIYERSGQGVTELNIYNTQGTNRGISIVTYGFMANVSLGIQGGIYFNATVNGTIDITAGNYIKSFQLLANTVVGDVPYAGTWIDVYGMR